MHPASPDNEERRLLAEYETATRRYSWAVSELVRQRPTVSHDEYLKLLRLAGEANDDCEEARIALRDFRNTA